jgi:hypothetical protein
MKNIITTLLILIGLESIAQSENNLTKLIDKKWVIEYYEIDGQDWPITDVEKDDYTVFYYDHSVKRVDYGITKLSKWQYDSAKNSVVLSSDGEVSTEMRICSLNEDKLVWQTTNQKGMKVIIHMYNSYEK